MRWIAGVGVLLADLGSVGIVFPLECRESLLYIIGAGILAYNLAFYLARTPAQTPEGAS